MISLPAAAVDGDATIYLEPNLRASQFCRLEIVLDWTFWNLECISPAKAWFIRGAKVSNAYIIVEILA